MIFSLDLLTCKRPLDLDLEPVLGRLARLALLASRLATIPVLLGRLLVKFSSPVEDGGIKAILEFVKRSGPAS